jgi:hypothetical protein
MSRIKDTSSTRIDDRRSAAKNKVNNPGLYPTSMKPKVNSSGPMTKPKVTPGPRKRAVPRSGPR